MRTSLRRSDRTPPGGAMPISTGATPPSPSVDTYRKLMQRRLIRARISDHQDDVVRVAALHHHDSCAAAGLPVGRALLQNALAPVKALLPVRGPDDVLDSHAPERMGGVAAHGTQDQLRSVAAAEQRRGRGLIGGLQGEDIGVEADRPT